MQLLLKVQLLIEQMQLLLKTQLLIVLMYSDAAYLLRQISSCISLALLNSCWSRFLYTSGQFIKI